MISGDACNSDKELEKIVKYRLLKDEAGSMWTRRRMFLIPVAVGVLGVLTSKFKKYIREIEIDMRTEQTPKQLIYWSS